jgi:hypothetical protein
MKQKNYSWISIVILLLSITSCSKDAVVTPVQSPAQEKTLNLLASRWTENGDNTFESNFINVLSSGQPSNASPASVKVYVVANSRESLISEGGIDYMTGRLWATREGNSLRIFFRPATIGSKIPFGGVELKVVFS